MGLYTASASTEKLQLQVTVAVEILCFLFTKTEFSCLELELTALSQCDSQRLSSINLALQS